MACASGIEVSQEIQQNFSQARDTNSRMFKLQIQDESLVSTTIPAAGSEEDDFALLQEQIDGEDPCYMCFRLDSRSAPAEWVFILFVPGTAKVRDKMLYASTRDTVKRELGYSFFCDEMYANDKSECSYKAYQDKIAHDKADAPVTADERLLEEEKMAERDLSKQSTASVMFPMTDEAHAALGQVAAKSLDVVQLRLDPDREELELVGSGSFTSVKDIAGQLSPQEPRFVYMYFPHTFADAQQTPLLFLYICPESAPIKQKMLYSTCKQPLLTASSGLGVQVDKSLEVRDLADLDDHYVVSELHPQEPTPAVAPRASRPSRPGKGGRRLM
eukprot:CAMPEP_0175950644 /NCGR_PEP_ID=MMETSP0108-20121206/29737_1 /TAXON_ID=195067 ORGANISM="Goniomonas pacifica, Strain CCMP1869" /NCGR_SAMPLE_ID=MMETSP0108 /ASSEMBLY_ACC=CAM_ASM_000204 /LENGTH=329 /DNA_ID=CAMNT_0017276771 /DNA_START=6 /DNA_END=995 /DNA_ORIENTATION=+